MPRVTKESQYARQRRLFQLYGVRSKLEKRGKDVLDDAGIDYEYESTTFEYEVAPKVRKYTPDFKVGSKFYEFKGHWDVEDRQKHVLIKSQIPDLDLTMVFHRPENKINKLSKTSYSDFCDKHGIKWISIEKFLEEYGHVKRTYERKERSKAPRLEREKTVRKRVRIAKEIGVDPEALGAVHEPQPGTTRIRIPLPQRKR